MKQLPPQRLRPHYYESVEQALRRAFMTNLFDPLIGILREGTTQAEEFENAAPAANKPLQRALQKGTIQYHDGIFSGDVDGRIGTYLRSLGAEFVEGEWHLPEFIAPGWLRAEAAAAQRRAKVVYDKLARELSDIQQKLEAGQLVAPIPAADAIDAIEEGFESAASALEIAKRIPSSQRAAMEAQYAQDVRPYVAAATSEYIDDLHKAVTAHAAAGYRYENIVEEIQHQIDVSERKARFLARQETSLFMAAYRETRFTAAGVRRYKWSTSHDVKVRPHGNDSKAKKYGDHRVLDGRIFSYDTKAPAQFMSSKKPCNPGEDFQCRCVDIPILE